LKPPKPNRKLRICTKFDQDVFSVTSVVEPDKEYIQGWSFVNTEKKEANVGIGFGTGKKF